MWAGFTLFVLYGGLLPFQLTTDPARVGANWSRVGSNPFVSPDTGRRLSLPDVAQNVLLFLPFGLLGVCAIESPDERPPAATIARVTGCALLLSIAVEGLQLFTLDRVSSVADVGADTLGALAGAAACYPLRAAWRRSAAAPRARALAALPTFSPFALAAALVCVAAWQPFDVTLDVGNAVQKWHAWHRDAWQPTTLSAGVIDAVRFLLFTLSGTLWLREAGLRRSALWAALLAGATACALEASKVVIESRIPGAATPLFELPGGLAGVWLARGWPWGRSPLFWAGGLSVVSAIYAAIEWPRLPLEPMVAVSRSLEVLLIVAMATVAIRLARRTAVGT